MQPFENREKSRLNVQSSVVFTIVLDYRRLFISMQDTKGILAFV